MGLTVLADPIPVVVEEEKKAVNIEPTATPKSNKVISKPTPEDDLDEDGETDTKAPKKGVKTRGSTGKKLAEEGPAVASKSIEK